MRLALLLVTFVATFCLAIPFQGSTSYDCNQQCDGGDVYYEIVASIESYLIQNEEAGIDEEFITRTFHNGTFDPSTLLGPTITFKPGQVVNIMMRNKIDPDQAEELGPKVGTIEDYLYYMDPNNEKTGYYGMQEYGFQYTGVYTGNASEVNVVQQQDIPHSYNTIDLHTHGLQVIPHLFFPQGTSNRTADYIQIHPGQCYCYTFKIPQDHPTGTFWYHIHRHGSTAIQAWSGLAGYIFVQGTYDNELERQNVSRTEPFALWDPHFQRLPPANDKDNKYANKLTVANRFGVGTFLIDQTDAGIIQYLVNNQYIPTFNQVVNETVRYAFLCATTENLATFRVIDENNKNYPFYVSASDGIAYAQPQQRPFLVVGGGMRDDILLQFSEPGTYSIVSDGLEHLQYFGTGPSNQTIAKIVVTNSGAFPEAIDISAMRFTPGISRGPIKREEISRIRYVTFDLGGDSNIAPFPQYLVNGKMYDYQEIQEEITIGTAEEWIIFNGRNATHPFHIHVNPYQVKESTSAFMPTNPYMKEMLAVSPKDVWRDTFIVPPLGFTRIWIRFEDKSDCDLFGKSVFHCHFLAHEDTGMIANMMLYQKSNKQQH